jgi:PAZ domain
MQDTYIINNVFRTIRRKLEAILGLYVNSGRSIFTTTDLTDSLLIITEFQGSKYEVLINAESKKFFSGKSLANSKMEDHNVIHTLINIIIKQALRETDLRQIGKQPRFFDISKAISVEGSGLQACPGFRASAFNYTSGFALVLDNINKFLSNKSCYERIEEIYNSDYIDDKKGKILEEFKYKSVIGNWGNKKAYIVYDVIFDKTPFTLFFSTHQGEKISVAEYFLTTYKLKVTARKQPLFLVKINSKECHLPTEFCSIDGVPQTIREDPMKMRNVLSACRKNPEQKFQAIQDFTKDLFSQKALKDWGISIDY